MHPNLRISRKISAQILMTPRVVGAFSVIVQLHRLIVYTALFYTVTQEAGLADISITGPRAAAEKLVPPPTLPRTWARDGHVGDVPPVHTWVSAPGHVSCPHLGPGVAGHVGGYTWVSAPGHELGTCLVHTWA